MFRTFFLLLSISWISVFGQSKSSYIEVLGIAQDGGYPHMGCEKEGCKLAWENPALAREVSSLALVDTSENKWWLFDATPDIKKQLHDFHAKHPQLPYLPEGIFITHAHIGHYTGLMEFGKEVMNTKELKVYVLPKLKSFLENNGPWSQLMQLHNINIIPVKADEPIKIEKNTITAFTVPHRDEYSETAGFNITTPEKKYLFIPDIDKWSKWNKSIIDKVKKVDYAFVDATFFSADELPNRAISEVPHSLVTETMSLFSKENPMTKAKIHFIHLNHSNPILWKTEAKTEVLGKGFNLAEQGKDY